jgi:hypothetical protein
LGKFESLVPRDLYRINTDSTSILGNVYSRVFGGTAFTSMVTGVLFLVPVSYTHPPFFEGEIPD